MGQKLITLTKSHKEQLQLLSIPVRVFYSKLPCTRGTPQIQTISSFTSRYKSKSDTKLIPILFDVNFAFRSYTSNRYEKGNDWYLRVLNKTATGFSLMKC